MSTKPHFTRRELLWQAGGGLGGIALAYLLGMDGALAEAAPAARGGLHHPARAKRVVQLFMSGAASQADTFDYGLGSLNENLPSFVVLPDPRGFAPNGPANWSAGFLPAAHQGTMVKAGSPNPIFDLYPPQGEGITPESEQDGLALLRRLNKEHQ